MSTIEWFRQGTLPDMLATISEVLRSLDIDFFLVGALARDIRLSVDPALAPKRATKDVDIALWVASEEEFAKVKAVLLATGEFTAHEREAIKLFYRHAIEVDLLPFGDIEDDFREVRIERPQPFVLDVPGFREVFPEAEVLIVAGVEVRVCSLEGLVLLKVIANHHNPSRTKDVEDIAHILRVYFDVETEKIFTSFTDVPDRYDTADPDYLPKVSAHVIGRIIGRLLKDSLALLQQVQEILDAKAVRPFWREIAAGLLDQDQ
jgi:predicted nucleotidyltransferase